MRSRPSLSFLRPSRGRRRKARAASADPAVPKDAWSAEDGDRPRGLCASCVNYPHCQYAKPAGGVLQCEEYR